MAMRHLEPLASRFDLAVLPLHGSLPADEQMLALRPSTHRKIILATNIAETSLTIDGVRWVIDAGLASPAFDPRRGLDRLEFEAPYSKASATRRHRPCRTHRPGPMRAAWSAKEQFALDDSNCPKSSGMTIGTAVLDLHAWGKPDAAAFGSFQPPPAEALLSAQRLLEMLARSIARVDAAWKTADEAAASSAPRPAAFAAADAGCPAEGATLATLLSEKDIRRPNFTQPPHLRSPATQGDSDLLLRMDELDGHSRDGSDSVAIRRVGGERRTSSPGPAAQRCSDAISVADANPSRRAKRS